MNYRFNVDEIPTLESALESMTADELKRLTAKTAEKSRSRKGDMVAVIMHHMAGEGLRAVWDSLDELQRAAVAEGVYSHPTPFNAGLFRAKYGGDPIWGSKGRASYDYIPSNLCLIFYRNGSIPADLRERLLTFVPAPPRAAIATVDQLPAAFDRTFERGNKKESTREEWTEAIPVIVFETERTAQRELHSVLRLVDMGKVVVSDKTLRASTSTVAAINAALEGGDYYPHVAAKDKWTDENAGPIRAFAWPLIIQAGGIAELAGTRLQLTKAGRKALSDPPAQTLRTLWKKWMKTTILDELARIDCVKGQTGKAKRSLTAVSSRREAIAHSLSECPLGEWIAIDEFIRYMRASGKFFDVSHGEFGLYVSDAQYGTLGYAGLGCLNQRYLFALLLEYAATLGMIDVALIPPAGARKDYHMLWGSDDLPFFSRYDGLFYFRLTPLGAYCLGMESDYRTQAVEAKPVLRVLPNLEIAATGSELEHSDRLALNAYAIPISDFVWRLEAGALLAAIEAGRQVEEIREFLLARSGEPIPETVVRLLNDVAARTTKLHDRGLARLIECADPALAALIANDTRTRKLCMRAGEKHLVVAASSESAFRRALRDVGYLLAAGGNPSEKRKSANPPLAEV